MAGPTSRFARTLRRLIIQPERSPVRETARFRGQIAAFTAQKGGVGKTTTAVQLAASLCRYHEKRVLLIDMDPQGHVASSMKRQVGDGTGAFSDFFLNRGTTADLLRLRRPTSVQGLDVIPADRKLGDVENAIAGKFGKEFLLKNAVRAIPDPYDYILIDCPPHLGTLTVNALTAAHGLVVPTDLSILSMEGVHDLLDTVGHICEHLNPELEIWGVLLTKVDKRNKSLNETLRKNLESAFAELLFDAEISTNTAIQKAQMQGKVIFDYDAGSTSAHNYRALAAEFLARATEGEKN
ncbi:MAG: ParA family protein [Deltaproteobacteria bacterium]|nr:ParA family protein [Deltaproteobacteria bacterium]